MLAQNEGPRAEVVLLTALDLEYDAVRRYLNDVRAHVDDNGEHYETGELPGGQCRVALMLTGHGTVAAAALTSRVVTYFQPSTLIFVGVAGGLGNGVNLGDIVVSTRVHAYQGGRVENSGFRSRPKSWAISPRLEQDAKRVVRDGTWLRLLPHEIAAPAVHFKPIVSGDVVLDANTGHLADLITEHFNDAVAIDMESAGVAEAAHRHDFYRTVTVRAISDRADGSKSTTDSAGWQQRAVVNAAAFAVALARRVAGTPDGTPSPGTSPYRGLAAFGEDDAELFFGRSEATNELVSMVSTRRFVAVVGRSGSGKSSLVHAGLIPVARRRNWASAVFRPLPGVSAAVALAGGLLPLLRPDLDHATALEHRAALAEAISDGRLAEIVNDVLKAADASRLLVCIDQFEELVAWQEEAAAALADLLLRLAAGPAPAHVVLTVRTETLDVVVHRLGLGDVIGNAVFLLAPMNVDQLRAAIEEPVRSTEVRFEPGLAVRVLEEARDAPAALTLTQFALTRLWEDQNNNQMTHQVYDGFGGIGGALASYAEQVWTEDLNETQRGDARRLLVQLARPEVDGFMRRTARQTELTPDLVSLARYLATTRLLVTGTDAAGELTIDLAHATLAKHWRRLDEWLTEEREFRAWQEDLREGIRRDEPLRGSRLGEALRWLSTHHHGISKAEAAFILLGRRHRRRRRALWRGLLLVVVVLCVIASTFAVNLRQRTSELEDQLRHNAAQALVAQARDHIGSDPDTAALLSVAAYRSSQDPPALLNLAGEYQRFRAVTSVVSPRVGQVLDMAVSADGKTVAVAGLEGAAVLQPDRHQASVEAHGSDVRRVALSQDGRLLATANDLGQIEIGRRGEEPTVLRPGGPQVNLPSVLRFAERGDRLLATLPNSGLAVWDVASGKELNVPASVKQAAQSAKSVWFGPSGHDVVLVSKGELALWSLDHESHVPVGILAERSRTVVSGDGRVAVTCTDGTLVFWDLNTATERTRHTIPDAACPIANQAAIDFHGRFVTAFSPSESGSHPRSAMWLVNETISSPARVAVPAPAEPGTTVAPWLTSTAAGSRMVTAVGTGIVVVDIPPFAFTPLNVPGVGSPLTSPDLRYAITTSTRPTEALTLWNTDGEVVTSVANPIGLVPRWFSSDGSRMIALDPDVEIAVIFDVPSMRIVNTVVLPAEMKKNREDFPGRFNIACITELATPEEVAIVYAGLVIRIDARIGASTMNPLRLWRSGAELGRLADTVSCHGRPHHVEIAFDVGTSVELWNLNNGTRKILPVDEIGKISSLRFSGNGTLLAVSGYAGVIDIWDVDRRQQKGQPRQVVEANLGVAIKSFPKVDRMIVRGGVALRIWDPTRDAAIADIETAAPDSGTVSPDGGMIAYWGLAGLTKMPLDPAKWVSHLCDMVGRDLTTAERRDLPPGSPSGQVC